MAIDELSDGYVRARSVDGDDDAPADQRRPLTARAATARARHSANKRTLTVRARAASAVGADEPLPLVPAPALAALLRAAQTDASADRCAQCVALLRALAPAADAPR